MVAAWWTPDTGRARRRCAHTPAAWLSKPYIVRLLCTCACMLGGAAVQPLRQTGRSKFWPCLVNNPLSQDRWAPSNWLEAAQPVAAFLYNLVTKFPQQLADRSTDVADCLAALQELAARPGAAAVPGAQLLQKQLEKLGRCALGSAGVCGWP